MIQCVLFDLDGTLADTVEDLVSALNQLRLSQQLEPVSIDSIRPYVSQGTPGMLKAAYGIDTHHKDFASLKEQFLNLYHQQLCQKTQLFPGIELCLNELDNNHIAWGIVTNKPEFLTQPLLKQLALEQRAQVIVCGDTFPHKKPHPMPLLEACKTLNTDPQHCIYIGDDKRDMQAAKAANMCSVAATWGYIPPDENPNQWNADYLLKSSSALSALLKQLIEQHT